MRMGSSRKRLKTKTRIISMKELKELFEDNYLLGCIKYNNSYSIYLMPIAWWILNYKKYDPSYNPNDWTDVYRENILNVTDDKIDGFLKSIEQDRLSLDEVQLLGNDIPHEYLHINFFVDFDKKMFINGYSDNVAVEEYLPDESWRGQIDNSINYLPDNIRSLFR
jgi:hypothetical protein